MTRILTIRPREGAQATRTLATQMGLEVHLFPLFAIEPRDWQAPEAEQIDALLVGSANALLHAGRQLARFLSKPVHAVGAKTAAAAGAAGLTIGLVGQGGLQNVVDSLPRGTHRLLRLAGEKHVALQAPQTVHITTRIVYAAKAMPMPESMARTLEQRALVLLHSGEAARHLRCECLRLGVDKRRIMIAALGPRILEMAGEGWADGRSASAPRDEAVLALAREMWQG